MFRIIFYIFQFFFLLILPFIGLIRGAVYFHEVYDCFPWLAILGGIGITILVLFIYFTLIYDRLFGSVGNFKVVKFRLWLVVILVFAYSIYGLVFLSEDHSKTSKVHQAFTSLHPILRLSVSTIVLIDDGLLITDSKRFPEDYRKMGLASKKQSLHYVQEDGYVYAVDIRTKGRGEFRNRLLQGYFQLMGLNTLRHVGTADHLHISLMNTKRPNAI